MVLTSRCSVFCRSNCQYDNMSLSSSVVPSLWKSASFQPCTTHAIRFPSNFHYTRPLFESLSTLYLLTSFILPSVLPNLFPILKINLLSNQLVQQLQRPSISFILSPASQIPINMLLYSLLTSQRLLIAFGTAHFSSNMTCSPSLITFTID